MKKRLTHFTKAGAARMVDVGAKAATKRFAVAESEVVMRPETMRAIRDRKVTKGDALEVARLAGIAAAKLTPQLIPLCHPISLTRVTVDVATPDAERVVFTSRAEAIDRTGVEMEALTSAAVAALTLYDMCKAIDREMEIRSVRLLEKAGGKSGHFKRKNRIG